MRIFFITTEMIDSETLLPQDGGLANYLCKITVALANYNNDVNVITITKNIKKTVNFNGVNVIFTPLFNKKSLIDKITWKLKTKKQKHEHLCKIIHLKLQEEHKKNKIDIIQYASFQALGSHPESNIPSCVRISSYAKLWQKNYNYTNKQEIINEIKQFKEAKYLFGPSKQIADYIKKDLNLKKPIEIIETPYAPKLTKLDNSLFDKLKEKIETNEYLFFFGSIGLLKGAQEIADIAYDTLKKYPNLCIVLVGKQKKIGHHLPVDLIKRNAKQYSDRVIHFDKTSHEQLFPLITKSKAVILPSRIDNLPNTCIEAMGLGKIVIGSKGASFEQLIDDGISGFLCHASNAQSLQLAIDRLMTLNESKIKQMEYAAYERTKKLSLEIIVPQHIDFYNNVIKGWTQE